MCGIAGFWRPIGFQADAALVSLRQMTDALAHRGPDGEGQWVDADRGVALGHRRLSIVDLSPAGAQPMRSHSGRFTTVFNGEIYNYRALRTELLAAGCTFQGTSDTEVMLAGFDKWGLLKTLPKLAGMFAIAVWDAATDELYLIRDRMGEKPLFLAQFGGNVAFASEMKAFRCLPDFPVEIDSSAVADVLRRGYISGSHTIYRAATRLRPGSYAVIAARNGAASVRLESYWNVRDALPARSAQHDFSSDDEATNALDALLTGVVADEMVADVPVGAFLSGGIDSSLIVGLMQKVATRPVRTFTIGFRENSHDESPFAREVAKHLGTEHTEIMLTAQDALNFVERLPEIFDEPFADSSQLPTLLVSAVTRQHVTVALSGDGGDELFGGYSQYVSRDSFMRLIRRVPKVLRKPAGRMLELAPNRAVEALLSGGSTWPVNARTRLTKELTQESAANAYENSMARWVAPAQVMSAQYASTAAYASTSPWPTAPSDAEARMVYDMEHYLPNDILVKVDRSSMAASLETRAPLLDHRVVEFALQLPLEKKIRDGQGKFLLRNLLSRYVPTPLFDRPKQGFAIPIAHWLRGPLKDWGASVLAPDDFLNSWLRADVVSKVWDAHQRGEDHSERLWPMLTLMQWLRTNSPSTR